MMKTEKRYLVKYRLLFRNGKLKRKIKQTTLEVKTTIGPEKAMERTQKLWAKHGILIKPVSAEYLGEVKVLCCIEEKPFKQPKSQSENSGT